MSVFTRLLVIGYGVGWALFFHLVSVYMARMLGGQWARERVPLIGSLTWMGIGIGIVWVLLWATTGQWSVYISRAGVVLYTAPALYLSWKFYSSKLGVSAWQVVRWAWDRLLHG